MSLESAIADLVSASTGLTQSVNVTRAAVEATRDSALAQETPTETAKLATATAATAATASAATTASKLTTAASDYAAQKTSKGLAAVQTSADSELKDRLHRRDPARHPFRGARPSLVMDFVRQECHRNNAAGNLEPVDLNSFMTFTRASTATVVGPDGLIKEVASNVPRYGYDPVTGEALGLLIEEQRTNLLSGSVERLYLWDLARVDPIRSTILSPGGKLDAFKLTERQVSPAPEYYMRSMSGTSGSAGQTFCASVYVHTSSERTPRLRVTHTACAARTTEVSFDISTRSFGPPYGYVTSTGYSDAGNGWLRIWLVYTLPTASVTEWGINLWDGPTTGDGVSGVFIYGPQLEIGSFPTSYIPTPATFTGRASTKTYFDSNGVLQTAASGVAVTDYGYVDGRWVSKGLSLEPQATNLLTYSQQINSWATIQATASVGSVLSPDGVSYATKVVESADTIATGHYVTRGVPTASLNTQHTGSVFLKAAERTKAYINMHLGDGNAAGYFDLSAGTVLNSAGGAVSRVTNVGNGWYRCEVTAVTGASGTPNIAIFTVNSAGAKSYIGDGVSGIYVWGAQLETGHVATSYIPTTTAQVTRAADTSTSAQVTRAKDSAICAEINTIYNHEGGTLFASAMCGFGTALSSGVAYFYSSSVSPTHFNSFGINQAAGRIAHGNLAGANVVNLNAGTFTPNTFSCIALSYAAGKFIASRNSANSVANTTAKLFRGIDRLTLGRSAYNYNTGECSNGYIKQLTYFPRQLSDADLQALTILED